LSLLPLFSKLRALLHKTVTRKIVETVPPIKISHGWMETNSPSLSSLKIQNHIFRPFILLNLKLYCMQVTLYKSLDIYIVDLVSMFDNFLTVSFTHCLDNMFDWRHSFFKLAKATWMSRARSYENSGNKINLKKSSCVCTKE